MKSYSKLIQLVALSGVVYFLLAGTGYNIVDYCCDSCESVGIEYLSHHSCHDVHHPDTQLFNFNSFKDHSSSCCDHESTQPERNSSDGLLTSCQASDGHCELDRLQLDDYPVTASLQLKPDSSILTLPVAVVSTELLSAIESTLFLQYPPPDPVFRMGRFLLAQKSVLII